jgi:RNA polymerase sigma-70 factor (ECF subfamily)
MKLRPRVVSRNCGERGARRRDYRVAVPHFSPDLADLDALDAFVRRLSRRLCSDDAAADDLAQEVWARALVSPPAQGSNWRGWLTAVARNAARRAFRTDRRRRAREESRPAVGPAPSAAAVAEAEEARRRVMDAVLAMREPFRETLLLRWWADLTPTEVSARTGVPAATVRSRTFAALGELRTRLDRDFDGDRGRWTSALLGTAGTWGDGTGGALVEGARWAMTAKSKIALVGAAALLAAIGALRSFSGADPRPPGSRTGTDSPESAASRASDPTGRAVAGDAASRVVADARIDRAPFREEAPTGSILVALVDTDERPLPDRPVWASPAVAAGVPTSLRCARTGADGRARLTGVPPGAVDVAADTGVRDRVDVVAGAEVAVVLRHGFGRAFAARVVDESGAPVRGAAVYLGGAAWTPATASARTDAEGLFRLDRMEGLFRLTVVAVGFLPLSHVPLGDRAGETPTLKLRRGGFVLAGSVVDAATGAPVAGAVVEVQPPAEADPGPFAGGAPTQRTLTDASGRFVFDAVPDGCVAGAARARGFAPASFAVEGSAPREVRLLRGGVVEGRTFFEDGSPASGAEVSLTSADAERPQRTTAEADGSFRFDAAPAGVVTATAYVRGKGRSAPTAVTVSAGGVARVELPLRRGPTLVVKVVDAAERPVPGADVFASLRGAAAPGDDGDRAANGSADDEGRLTLGALAAGVFVVTARADRGGRDATEATARIPADGVEREVRFVEPPRKTSRVVGVVRGAAARTASLKLNERGRRTRIDCETDAQGKFDSGPIPAGRYDLTANANDRAAAPRALASRTLADGETWDLGEIEFPGFGTLTVRVSPSPAKRVAVEAVEADGGEPYGAAAFFTDGAARLDLFAGRYLLRVDDEAGCADRVVEVSAGEATTIDLAAAEGVEATFRVAGFDAAADGAPATVRIVDVRDGALVRLRAVTASAEQPDLSPPIRLRLPPGRYRALVELDGRAAERAFEVADVPVALTVGF